MRLVPIGASDLAARLRLVKVARADGRPFVGARLRDALELARRRGTELRVIDDSVLAWTPNYQGRRVTAFVENGIVVRPEVGLAPSAASGFVCE